MESIIVSTLVAGSLYALVAGGLSLVWGALGVFNFAHGVLIMAAAYAAWFVASPSGLGLGLPTGIVAAIAFMAVLGAVLYLILVRPWIGKPEAGLAVIMTTIAGAIFVENLALLLFGAHFKAIDQIVVGTISIGNMTLQAQELLAIVLAPILLVGLALFLTRHKDGLAIRAIAQNREGAQLLGIPVDRIYITTFSVSAMLAGIAGIMLAGLFNINPSMGSDPLLRAFIVVVFGGLGSLPGTIVGAYAIALIEAISSYYIGVYYTPVVLFVVLIAILTVKPTGLLGRA